MKHKVKTEEEKVANAIAKVVSDLRLDLTMIGVYLAWVMPNVSFRRLVEITEVAQDEKEKHYGRNDI